MKGFSGFPAGKVRFTPLPNLFFSKLLPAIDDLAELKVTLHIFWLLHQKKGYPRYVSRRELEADGVLLGGLRGTGQEPEEFLGQRSGQARQGDERDDWYFMNTDTGRKAVEKIRRGELELEAATSPGEVRLEAQRPNIFALYEQNIGLLTPLIAEELRDAEKTYPADWIEEAFRIAVEHNARHWRYVRSILERWAAEGKDNGGEKSGRRWYTKEEYEKFIKH
jgi:DNA replication protein